MSNHQVTFLRCLSIAAEERKLDRYYQEHGAQLKVELGREPTDKELQDRHMMEQGEPFASIWRQIKELETNKKKRG